MQAGTPLVVGTGAGGGGVGSVDCGASCFLLARLACLWSRRIVGERYMSGEALGPEVLRWVGNSLWR